MTPLLIDFDRVIHDFDQPVPGRKMGPPMPRALEAITLLASRRYPVKVFTLWATTPAGKKTVEDWLKYWKFPALEVTNIKSNGWIIDDKAIRFVDWETTIKEISRL